MVAAIHVRGSADEVDPRTARPGQGRPRQSVEPTHQFLVRHLLDDMDGEFGPTAECLERIEQALALAPARQVDGDRQARLKSQVETRAFTCERGIALWRVLLGTEDESGELAIRIKRARETAVTRMELMYRPELATLAPEERQQTLIALEAITDIESWARMREMHGLSFEEACTVWINAIDRMLPPTPTAK